MDFPLADVLGSALPRSVYPVVLARQNTPVVGTWEVSPSALSLSLSLSPTGGWIRVSASWVRNLIKTACCLPPSRMPLPRSWPRPQRGDNKKKTVGCIVVSDARRYSRRYSLLYNTLLV